MRKKEEILNLPNLLTAARLAITFFIVSSILQNDLYKFIIFFSMAVLTELDGTIARATKTETDFGKNFDSSVDAVFLSGIYVAIMLSLPGIALYLAIIAGSTVLRIIGCLLLSKKSGKMRFYIPEGKHDKYWFLMRISKISSPLLWATSILFFIGFEYSVLILAFISFSKAVEGITFLRRGIVSTKQKTL